MKIGLVLEGGGMRGAYTMGVLDEMMRSGLGFDEVVGVSAGACNGVSYVSRQPGRSLRVALKYAPDPRYISWRNYLRTGSVFGMDFAFDEIPNRLEPFDYEAFLTSPCAFFAGVTDVRTGQPVFFDHSHMNGTAVILRASSAIPCFSTVVEYQGGRYLDGGTSDPIPVHKALEDGCERVVAVLTRPRDYRKEPTGGRAFYRLFYRHDPEMVHALEQRHEIYAQQQALLRELEQQGRALVIAPREPIQVGRFEKKSKRLLAAWRTGAQDAAALEAQLRDFGVHPVEPLVLPEELLRQLG